MKQVVRLAIGCTVYFWWRLFSPRRLAAAQEQCFASHTLSFAERQLLAFTLFITRMNTHTASAYWAGSAGSRFHSHEHHRLTLESVATDNFYRRPMLDAFVARAAERLRPGATIVEIGCGAGGNLLYLEHQLPNLGFRFVGFDINSEVIASNQQSVRDDLSFEVKNCFAADITVPGDLGLICCAVLMYAQEADIERLLRGVIRTNQGRVLLGVSEPVDDPEAARASTHNNLALVHGYRRILRQ